MDPSVMVTAEQSPFEANGAAAAPLRGTDEYAAAFDLEVWKAQQQARFRAQLRQAKEKLEKKIYAELTSSDRQRVDELDGTRRELQAMAQRLETAGAALQKRHAQLEAREAAFEVRRVKVADQHETHLARVEQQARRVTEESAAQQEALKAQLREKNVIIDQLQERLRAVEGQFDTLQRRTARYFSDSNDTNEKALLREAETRLQEAEQTIELLQSQLKDQSDKVERLGRERDELLWKQHDYRSQIYTLQRQQRLAPQSRVSREIDSEYAYGGSPAPRANGHELEKGFGSAAGPRTREGRSDDMLARMLRDLKHEVSSRIHSGSGRSARDAVIPAIICERTAPSDGRGERGPPPPPPRPTTTDPYVLAERVGSVNRPPTVSTTSYADAPRTGPAASSVQEMLPRSVDSAAAALANTSAETADSCPRVDVQSWHSSDTDEANGREDAAAAVALPPLAPVREDQRAALPRSTPGRGSSLSPTPEEFAQAATVSSASAGTTRAEMESFVHQMKVNREKLLDTGVYTISHPVVKEMSEKIALYEQYLSRY